MRNASWIALAAALAIVAATLVGWRGSRPTSPTATVHSDGIAVAPTPATITIGIEEGGKLPDHLDAQPRDAAWAPVAEARLRTSFADVPHLGQAPRITCAATLCEVVGTFPAGPSPAETDAALAPFQGPAMAHTRADFADNAVRIDQPSDGPLRFTAWLVRR